MTRIEDGCVGCAAPGYPCLGAACPKRNMTVYYCDLCGEEIDPDEVYANEEHSELCAECLHKLYRRRTTDD